MQQTKFTQRRHRWRVWDVKQEWRTRCRHNSGISVWFWRLYLVVLVLQNTVPVVWSVMAMRALQAVRCVYKRCKMRGGCPPAVWSVLQFRQGLPCDRFWLQHLTRY